MRRGYARALSGEGVVAITEITDGMALVASTGAQVDPGVYWILAVAQVVVGQRAEALETVGRALALATQTGQRFNDAAFWTLRGWLLRKADHRPAEEAEALFHRALEIARNQQARCQELYAAMCLARLRRVQGKLAEGRAILEPVYGLRRKARASLCRLRWQVASESTDDEEESCIDPMPLF